MKAARTGLQLADVLRTIKIDCSLPAGPVGRKRSVVCILLSPCQSCHQYVAKTRKLKKEEKKAVKIISDNSKSEHACVTYKP